MARFVNLVTPIEEHKKRKIFIFGSRIKIYAENWYETRQKETEIGARLFAEGYQAAYEKMGIYFEIIDSYGHTETLTPFANCFIKDRGLIMEERKILIEEKDDYCEVSIRLGDCFLKKEIRGDKKFSLAFADGFNCPYHDLGMPLKIEEMKNAKEFKTISLTPLPFGK